MHKFFCSRQFSAKTIIQEGDVVLLRKKRPPFYKPILTRPLRRSRTLNRSIGFKVTVPERCIIGQGVGDIVTSDQGEEFRIHDPSLAEYVSLAPHLVTPIYPASAALLVNLLDLHPTTGGAGDPEAEPPLEIFEAGTGHGSLTLHLSRAIHAANSRPPSLPPRSVLKELRPYRKEKTFLGEQQIPQASSVAAATPVREDEQAGKISLNDQPAPQTSLLTPATALGGEQSSSGPSDSAPAGPLTQGPEDHRDSGQDVLVECVEWLKSSRDLLRDCEQALQYTQDMKAAYEDWLPTRRAIVQTLDISHQHSEHAEELIRSYRRGMYFANINFHVGTVTAYLEARLRDEPNGGGGAFLRHAILDLPQPEQYLELMARALRPHGLLLLFCPSVTQILPSMRRVKRAGLPFHLERVLEIGGAVGTAGRDWKVKLAKTKERLRAEARATAAEADRRAGACADTGAGAVEVGPALGAEEGSAGAGVEVDDDDDEWKIICHPEIGTRVVAGAFVAMFRRY